MSATGYFKVPTRGARAIDEVVPFDGRDLESVTAAWVFAQDLRSARGYPARDLLGVGGEPKKVVRWGAIQVDGPWSRAPRIDQ